ncbi:MAG: hypothetical protein KDD70_09300 [Bdellovibrionales bacterium]|nr:hypothetical protein [Bdellovibrionales bacterium]
MAIRRQSQYRVSRIPLPSPGTVSDRARETLKHLEHGWLPVHADLLVGIQANIHNDHYLENPETLLSDLKKDPGLFFTVSKRLKRYSDPEESGFDPLDLLLSLEQEQLKEVFNFEPGDYSVHRAGESSPSQELVHEIARIGGESAASIAEELDKPILTAHEGALFRTLGISLLAWNYPKLFSQALSTHKTKGADFDRELQNYFQISPQQIGARFARELEMSREIKQSLLPRPQRDLLAEVDLKEQFHLTDICQLSELFARAQEPSYFPDAEEQWAAKESALKPILGAEVFTELHLKAETIAEEKTSATDFGDLHEYIIVRKEPVIEGPVLPESNPHLAHCPESVQQAFIAIHRELERSKTALDAIKLLLQRGIPETGAIRGCLYLQRKNDFRLQAALRFGDSPLPRYQKFLLDARNGILDAIHSTAPFVHEGKGVTGAHITQVRGGLGNGAPPGVLYVEISDKAMKEADYNPTVMFHVIRSALKECLKGLQEGDQSRMSFY